MTDQMDRLVAEAGEKMPREWLGTGDLPDDVVAQEQLGPSFEEMMAVVDKRRGRR